MKLREIEEPVSNLGKAESGVDTRICVWIKGFWAKDNFLTWILGVAEVINTELSV